MNVTKMIFGTLLCIAGVALGLWAGFWWAFIGGIVEVINALKADDIQALAVAFGVARVVCAGFIGGIAALCLIAPGAALIKTA